MAYHLNPVTDLQDDLAGEVGNVAHAFIIDDNARNIDVLGMMLEKEGMSHSSAKTVHQVENTLDQLGDVDVVFLDLEFPVGNGFQILRLLKARPNFAEVPIVAYSVHTSEIDVARRAGFDSFLGKPLNSQQFPEQLRRILTGIPVWES